MFERGAADGPRILEGGAHFRIKIVARRDLAQVQKQTTNRVTNPNNRHSRRPGTRFCSCETTLSPGVGLPRATNGTTKYVDYSPPAEQHTRKNKRWVAFRPKTRSIQPQIPHDGRFMVLNVHRIQCRQPIMLEPWRLAFAGA